MAKPRRPSRTAVVEKAEAQVSAPVSRKPAAKAAVEAKPVENQGLWAVAMLRIAVELKRPNAPGLEEIVDGVAERMGISKREFKQYLETNLGLLKTAARTRGYVP